MKIENYVIPFLATYLIFVFAVISAYFFFIKKDYLLTFQLIVCLIFEKIIEMAVKMAFFFPRPYILNHLPTLVAVCPTDSSFFSGHTAMAATLATVIFLKHKRLGIILFLITLLIGAARVAANVHYPLDVISGLALGVTIGASCGKIEVYARHRHSTSGRKNKRKK